MTRRTDWGLDWKLWKELGPSVLGPRLIQSGASRRAVHIVELWSSGAVASSSCQKVANRQLPCQLLILGMLHLLNSPSTCRLGLPHKVLVQQWIASPCQNHFLNDGLDPGEIWVYSTIPYAIDDFDFAGDFEGNILQLMQIV